MMNLQEVFETLCAASEYDEMPVRHNEEILNAELAMQVMEAGGWQLDTSESEDPHFKVNVLFQAHLSRLALPISDYVLDTKSALDQSIRILQAMIDVATQEGWITPALNCILLLQMLSQGLRQTQPAVACLPHMGKKVAARLAKSNVDSLPKLLECLRSDSGLSLIKKCGLHHRKAVAAANICSSLPVVKMEIAPLEENTSTNELVVSVKVHKKNFKRNANAYAPRFPKVKREGWYVIAGNREANEIYALKRISFQDKAHLTTKLKFSKKDKSSVKLFLLSDTYLGLDQESCIEM